MKYNLQYYAIIIAVLCCLIGCSQQSPSKVIEVQQIDNNTRIYVIDSCEYIGNLYGGNGDYLTHKGNCKFCRQRDSLQTVLNKK